MAIERLLEVFGVCPKITQLEAFLIKEQENTVIQFSSNFQVTWIQEELKNKLKKIVTSTNIDKVGVGL